MTEIGERISVVAAFSPSYKLKPLRFGWGKRICNIKEVTYHWVTRDGINIRHHFSVTDGKTLYEIAFDIQSLVWVLERLDTGD